MGNRFLSGLSRHCSSLPRNEPRTNSIWRKIIAHNSAISMETISGAKSAWIDLHAQEKRIAKSKLMSDFNNIIRFTDSGKKQIDTRN